LRRVRVVFGHSFDQGAYPGPLSDRDAVLGEAWVGELGLLKIVETMTGMGGVHAEVTLAERAASLVPFRSCVRARVRGPRRSRSIRSRWRAR
jgi:hypothetical protein